MNSSLNLYYTHISWSNHILKFWKPIHGSNFVVSRPFQCNHKTNIDISASPSVKECHQGDAQYSGIFRSMGCDLLFDTCTEQGRRSMKQLVIHTLVMATWICVGVSLVF